MLYGAGKIEETEAYNFDEPDQNKRGQGFYCASAHIVVHDGAVTYLNQDGVVVTTTRAHVIWKRPPWVVMEFPGELVTQ